MAPNHDHHAKAAKAARVDEVLKDLQVLGQTKEEFQFLLAIAFEIMDRYGRMLCFINHEQPEPEVPEPRPLNYNERLLIQGWGCRTSSGRM